MISDQHQQFKHVPICQLNISGLSAHSKTSLSHFIYKRGIDVLAVQETGSDCELEVNTFPSMSSFSVLFDRGVSISIAHCYRPKRLAQLEEEGVGIVYAIATIGNRPIVLASCYCSPHPSSTDDISKLLCNIQRAWTFCKNSGIKGMIVLGDMNARSQKWGDKVQNSRGKVLADFVSKHDFSLTAPSCNTFVSTNGGSIIDVCLAY